MDILSNFAENLSALMSEKGLNAPALAKILETDRSNITRYLAGERLPLYHGFIKILACFNVSADVLLGLADYSEHTDFLPVEDFGERLRTVMGETKTSQYALNKRAGFSSASVHNWLTDKDVPTVDNLARLASYMEISVDYLLGRIS